MRSLTGTFDHYLDQLETQLPPLPAAALRVQRRIGKRVASIMCDVATTVQGSARTAADETAESASTIMGTARSARDDVVDTVAVGGRRVAGQARAESAQAIEAIEVEAERAAESGRAEMSDLRDDAIDALDAVQIAIDPDLTATTEAYEDLTKQELYDRAARMEIAGRSSMNKAELIEAIRAAS